MLGERTLYLICKCYHARFANEWKEMRWGARADCCAELRPWLGQKCLFSIRSLDRRSTAASEVIRSRLGGISSLGFGEVAQFVAGFAYPHRGLSCLVRHGMCCGDADAFG